MNNKPQADLQTVVAFLLGEGPLDGVHYGEPHPTKAGKHWWRKHLRAALSAQVAGQSSEVAQAEMTVTVCYFPGKGEADLTWKCNSTGNRFALTVPLTAEQGNALANTVYPCINWSATPTAPQVGAESYPPMPIPESGDGVVSGAAMAVNSAIHRIDVGNTDGALAALKDAKRLLAAALVAPMSAPAGALPGKQDAAFEAARQKLCKLPRYSFVIDRRGNLRRCEDRSGNWIEFDGAHELFDPVVIDAAKGVA